MLALAALGLVVSGSGCAAGLGGVDHDAATGAEVIATDPTRAQPGAGDDDTTDRDTTDRDTTDRDSTAPGSTEPGRTPSVPRRPTRDATSLPSRSPSVTATRTVTTPTSSRTTLPQPSYSGYTMCPDISELNPVFSAKKIGTDRALGTDIVELTFTYTNPLGHALFLMGSVGYVDSEGYESDLYSRPGGLVFDDARLERGTHTVVLQLEDVWGEAAGASIYFTYWSLAGTALDSSRPVPCEPSRGYSSH